MCADGPFHLSFAKGTCLAVTNWFWLPAAAGSHIASDFRSFCQTQGVFHICAEISDRAFNQRKRAAYYDALEAANKRNEITAWLTYFGETVLDAQTHSLALIDFLIAKTQFYDRFRDRLNERQARTIARMFREGLDGFIGGLSAANYITITATSRATATRDLHELVDMGALRQTGTLKSTRYYLDLGQ